MPLSPLSYLLQCLSYCYELCPLELRARQYCFHKKKEIIFLNRETSVENGRFVLACESLNRVSPLPDSFVSTSSCNTAGSLGHEDFDLSDITLDGLFWWFCLIYALFPQWLCVESLLLLLLFFFKLHLAMWIMSCSIEICAWWTIHLAFHKAKKLQLHLSFWYVFCLLPFQYREAFKHSQNPFSIVKKCKITVWQ